MTHTNMSYTSMSHLINCIFQKEAQTEAAWDFIDFLNENGDLTLSEVEHVTLMRKKCKGDKGSVRDSINSSGEICKDER